MKIELAWFKLTESRSIFIRGGESGFMTYCVKTKASSAKGVKDDSHGKFFQTYAESVG
jgi:hypothetical protein